MLQKIFKPFVTATVTGVSTRYATVIISTLLTFAGLLGWLTAEQIAALKESVPTLVTAVAALVAAGIPVYAAITKSSSDKAAEAAKQIDQKLPKDEPVVIQTPDPHKPNIFVPPPDSSGR